ncbi:xanthine dehydrogenase YagR molybdenum-binding subunit [Pseudomonas duriflava]|uniref:Xanthine dehydrogenase YagR molybdenum-binding subunit n=1 Tax=Pseudomonas duriflava TaxID=459528 RepID=A0A562QP98_9PSED|nr:xanthine dehydrogenase family protein molybdopterin-binding subunit [Pseudomonas duriflava]TWI58579.1 xanthine dehydrogenase YagR molybdenum-binding subunit [Pseudomonas duriflava]
MTIHLEKAVSRVDGPLKVTGRALYAGEFGTADLCTGYVVNSSIAKGRILRIDTTEALKVVGVLDVLTHENRPAVASYNESYTDMDAADGKHFRPLYNDRILYSMQPVALVVAESFEAARYAASLVRVDYESEPPQADLYAQRSEAHKAPTELPPDRGDAEEAWTQAPVKVEAEYHSAAEFHNPMEMHASTVIYSTDGKLTIHDKTQGVQNSAQFISNIFGLPDGDVRVVTPFVGGAFGSGLRPQYQLVLATMAALKLKRSVRVVLSREQMFSFGHRPETLQHLKLACDQDGKLVSTIHEVMGETSSFEDFTEMVVVWSASLYQCPNVRLKYDLVPLDLYTPLDMRAPGAVLGVYALESAMDELSYAAGIDPLELRIRNFTATDPASGNNPYSSKELLECYRQGAERFGWNKRSPQPRSMKEGRQLIGYGMATGVWEAMQNPASAKAVITIDGSVVVSSATADIGTGTYTVMTQIAAECFGLPLEKVTFKLGDSTLPKAPLEGGSFTVSSVGSAVKQACEALQQQLLDQAKQDDQSPFKNFELTDVIFENGTMRIKASPQECIEITELLKQGGSPSMEALASASPKEERDNYTTATHSAVFVEVRVDEDFGTVQISRMVSAIAAGRILSLKPGRNQILGGMVWGIGMALQEEGMLDKKLARWMNHNIAEYHYPVNADIHDLDVIFVKEHDEIVNPLGAKGIGEIGIVGVAAAIANAIYHATGKRIRDLPITLDKVFQS